MGLIGDTHSQITRENGNELEFSSVLKRNIRQEVLILMTLL